MCDTARIENPPIIYKKIDKYFNELRTWGWIIHRSYKLKGSNERYDLLFSRTMFYMETEMMMDTFLYEVSLNHTRHRNGKLLYIVNEGDYYWTEDEVIEELKRIGIK
jgi:hypothetical protein